MEETAPPFESWAQHLRELGDRQLSDLAKDYQWLGEEARLPPDTDEQFEQRREAVIAECERRGMTAIAEKCRRPEARHGHMSGGGSA